MSDKSKQRARDYASKKGLSHQAALNARRPRHTLLNSGEREVETNLKGVAAANGARVFAKMRLADVVEIENSGISSEANSFALRCHLDFVVTDANTTPVFALEIRRQWPQWGMTS